MVVLLTLICWIAIYRLDRVIQPLNNWGLVDFSLNLHTKLTLFDRFKVQQVSKISIPVIQEDCNSTLLAQKQTSQLPSVTIRVDAHVATGRYRLDKKVILYQFTGTREGNRLTMITSSTKLNDFILIALKL